MSAPDYLSRLRQKNEEKNTPSSNCINPVKDFTQFVQFAPSAKKVDFLEAAPLPRIGAGDTVPLTASEETAIRAWLALIEETDPATIAKVIEQCQRDADARDYFTRRAAVELPKPDPFPDDRRACKQCVNLIARQCQAAKRGEIVASRNYEPVRDLLRRCEGYAPGAADTDRRPGRERWPGLTQKGGK
jgi:hypothetical protein